MTHVLSAVAWPYANGPRHIGHVAGFGVPSDVFSRYMRMAGHDVLMVSGTDEHGTPILVAADEEGVTARELADKNNAVIVHDLVDLGLSYDLFTRTTTGNHYKVVQELFTTVHRNGYMVEQTTYGRDQPVDRPHPARPLHRGHLPDLRVRRGARRPVRQLRQPARPDRPDRPALQDQRRDAGVRRDPALLPRPAGAGRRADDVPPGARGVRHLAAQRHQVLAQPDRGPPAAGDDPRHRLGHPGPDRRVARAADQAAVRLVRRRHRLPVRVDRVGPPAAASPSAGATGGTTPRRCPTTSWARTTSSSTPRSGRPSCSPTTARGRAAASRGSTAAEPADRGGLQRVHDDGEQAVLHQPRPRDPGRRHAGALPARRAALLHLRRRTGDLRRRLHLGRVRAAHQLRAGRRLGQPGQPHGHDDRQELRRDPGRGPARAGRRGGAGRRTRRVRHRRRPDRPAPAARRHRRGDAGGRRGEQVPHRHRALQDEGRRRARAARHRAARGGPVRARLQHAAVAVPAALGQRRSGRRWAARASSCRCRASSTSRTSTPTRAPGC